MRLKHKVVRYTVSLNEKEKEMLERLMDDDGKTEVSSYIGFLVSNEYKGRNIKNKRNAGRPRKEDEEEEPQDEELAYIPDPNYMNDRLLTKAEYERFFERRGEPVRPLDEYLANLPEDRRKLLLPHGEENNRQ